MGKGGIQHILAMTVGVQPGVEGGKAIPLSPCDVFPAGAVADPLGVQPVHKGAAIETVMLETVRPLYSVDRPLTEAPRIPEPYDTFANTFSYGKEVSA